MIKKSLTLIILALGLSCSTYAQQEASFYKKYAEKGDKEAMYNLANCYLKGNGGVQQDYNEATMWLTKASKKKYAPAQVSLAYCYLYGAGVMKDYAKAWELANKAANQDHAGAHYLLAQMYKEGIYVSQNESLYLKYL